MGQTLKLRVASVLIPVTLVLEVVEKNKPIPQDGMDEGGGGRDEMGERYAGKKME